MRLLLAPLNPCAMCVCGRLVVYPTWGFCGAGFFTLLHQRRLCFAAARAFFILVAKAFFCAADILRPAVTWLTAVFFFLAFLRPAVAAFLGALGKTPRFIVSRGCPDVMPSALSAIGIPIDARRPAIVCDAGRRKVVLCVIAREFRARYVLFRKPDQG